ncbi:MAG: hypothetical protein OHK0022_33940 [Roseiflexaceae bacterium]
MALHTLPLSDDELVRQYKAGRNTVELAQQCGCHPGTIRNRLLKRGVTLRSNKHKLKNLTPEELERLVQVEGLSDGQVGARYGVSNSTIRLLRLRYAIPSHPRNAGNAPRTRNGRPTRAFQQEQEAANG